MNENDKILSLDEARVVRERLSAPLYDEPEPNLSYEARAALVREATGGRIAVVGDQILVELEGRQTALPADDRDIIEGFIQGVRFMQGKPC